MSYPIRDENANLEEKSIAFFNSCKPAEWFVTRMFVNRK